MTEGLFGEEVKGNGKAKKVQEKKEEKKEEKNEGGIAAFIKTLELEYDESLVNNALENIHVELASGETVTLGEYENLITYKVVQYIKLGVGWKVTQMMRDQSKENKVDPIALKWVLKEMAEKELLYGLKPIEHVIPLDKNVYVGIAGRKYYARNTGQSYSVEYKETKNGKDDNVWDVDCLLTVKDKEGHISTFIGQGHASPNNVYRKDWCKDMAYKRALADALESAFPIGVSYEKSTMIQDLSQAQEEKKPELTDSIDEI